MVLSLFSASLLVYSLLLFPARVLFCFPTFVMPNVHRYDSSMPALQYGRCEPAGVRLFVLVFAADDNDNVRKYPVKRFSGNDARDRTALDTTMLDYSPLRISVTRVHIEQGWVRLCRTLPQCVHQPRVGLLQADCC